MTVSCWHTIEFPHKRVCSKARQTKENENEHLKTCAERNRGHDQRDTALIKEKDKVTQTFSLENVSLRCEV